jgi:REP element-mobilizing transposase RayT
MGGVPFPKRLRLPPDAYSNPEHTFHIAIRAMPGERPFRDTVLGDAIWQLLLNEPGRRKIRLVAACLMPDHLHVIAKPLEQNVQAWVGAFKSYSTRVSWRHGIHRAL